MESWQGRGPDTLLWIQVGLLASLSSPRREDHLGLHTRRAPPGGGWIQQEGLPQQEGGFSREVLCVVPWTEDKMVPGPVGNLVAPRVVLENAEPPGSLDGGGGAGKLRAQSQALHSPQDARQPDPIGCRPKCFPEGHSCSAVRPDGCLALWSGCKAGVVRDRSDALAG